MPAPTPADTPVSLATGHPDVVVFEDVGGRPSTCWLTTSGSLPIAARGTTEKMFSRHSVEPGRWWFATEPK